MYRFGAFQVDPRGHELRRDGTRVKIQGQSFIALLKLLEHPGELVTREDLTKAIWPADTFVDFDVGLNKVINRLREALGDSAETPTLIETAPKLGYRFIAPVESFDGDPVEKVRGRPAYYVPVIVGAIVVTVGTLAIWDRENRSFTIVEAAANGTGLHKIFPGSRGKWTSDGRLFIFENLRDGRTELWALPEERSFPWRNRDRSPIQLTTGPLAQ